MNIKSLLIGSAAALAVVSGAQAADAIVAAEPEPMEYVRVCDAFGTGYFYIPGTETCLKIGGEIRASVYFADPDFVNDDNADDNGPWESEVRARVTIEAKNDSEIGTIGSYIRLQGYGDLDYSDSSGAFSLDQAYITVGGFKVGYALAFWDDVGISGENDAFTNDTKFNLMSYTYSSDAFTVGLGIDDLSPSYLDNNVGVEAMVSASLGAATVSLYGVYDFEAEEGAIAGILSADVGPGTFELYGAYASDVSVYANVAEWTVGAAYGFKATDKLTITPSVNYWSDVGFVDGDAWGAGILAEYALAEGLTAAATVDYFDADGADDVWTGFVRLTRSF
ncbi:porin [Ciceribacter sp. L1K23]|uniref:porin n=1 Tax=Ciceribacter sp. L1K23 TaxID=2820276 RepID=UPI001B826EFB|nr:porin [Ciceribacter sp. L1K23]MBR0556238.1 porin [Ciceribacter sp. L1K23]